MIEVKKKEGESSSSMLYRFSRRVRQSGIMNETKKRRFKARNVNRRKRLLSAVYKHNKKAEVARLKKLGLA